MTLSTSNPWRSHSRPGDRAAPMRARLIGALALAVCAALVGAAVDPAGSRAQGGVAGPAYVVSEPPAPAPKPPEPTPGQAAPGAKPAQPVPPAPTLDELLGIAPRADKDKKEPALPSPDPNRQDLDRRLAGAAIDDAFKEAVALMAQSAQRLRLSKDTGLDTQRLQEDAVRKLDGLISQLQKQAQQQQQQSAQNSQPNDTKQPSQQQQQARPDDARRGDNNAELEPPSRRDGPLRPGVEAAKAAWGALPARVREMLLQGSGEKFSTPYEKLTEEYYKKLAEHRP